MRASVAPGCPRSAPRRVRGLHGVGGLRWAARLVEGGEAHRDGGIRRCGGHRPGRKDQIVGGRCLTVHGQQSGVGKDALVRGRCHHKRGLVDARHGRDLARQAHQGDRIEIEALRRTALMTRLLIAHLPWPPAPLQPP